MLRNSEIDQNFQIKEFVSGYVLAIGKVFPISVLLDWTMNFSSSVQVQLPRRCMVVAVDNPELR